MNNDAIQEDLLHELSCDPRMTSSHIAVTVKEAVVALSGFVPNYWEKLEAEKAVKPVRGLRGVANDINITLSSKRTDPEVARSAVHELASHVGIPSTEIKATVENGWLTLGGNVDWQYRKALAESLVKKLKGVMGSDSHIEIKPKVSPEEVKDKIKEALRRRAELDAGRIVVEVVGATVKLEGAVRSWAERSDAEHAAWSALGTANVENHLGVKPY